MSAGVRFNSADAAKKNAIAESGKSRMKITSSCCCHSTIPLTDIVPENTTSVSSASTIGTS